MMKWTVENGKIKADGKEQDFATYTWNLEPAGNDLFATRSLIIKEKAIPALRRLGFGREREQEMANINRQIAQPERVQLAANRVGCVPEQYKVEVGQWLRKCGEHEVADYLGV